MAKDTAKVTRRKAVAAASADNRNCGSSSIHEASGILKACAPTLVATRNTEVSLEDIDGQRTMISYLDICCFHFTCWRGACADGAKRFPMRKECCR